MSLIGPHAVLTGTCNILFADYSHHWSVHWSSLATATWGLVMPYWYILERMYEPLLIR